MPADSDPFRHHPGLRGLIADAESSYFRDFSKEKLLATLKEQRLPVPPTTPDAEREAGRKAALRAYGPGSVWIFAYGSLMWDPGIHFDEVRRAHVSGYARRFILKDTFGGRGDSEHPGVMVALDAVDGATCDGLVLRIPEALVEHETEILWRRERLAAAYLETEVVAETDHGPVRALTFVADHESILIDAFMSFDEQVECCATGTGFLGSSLEYARNIQAHFAEMQIEDAEVDLLVAAAESRAKTAPS